MNQLMAAWTALPLKRQVIVGLATAGMFAAIIALAQLSSRPSMALLYSGLDPTAAGEVLAALDQAGAAYEVRGSAIYVDGGKRDSLRMTLAGQGLPAAGALGYELLDTLSGFGTTAQMFDTAYWRAREGELARTILSSPDIRSARVHISAQSGRAFDRDFKPSASVAVTTTGAAVSPELAKSLRFLVASAVSGLTPERVSVIDSRTGTVLAADEEQSTSASGRSEELRANVQRLLEARVGPGKAVVEVAVEVGKDSESISQRTIDPNSRVQISTETEERSGDSNDQNNPGVTVASNLPAGAGTQGGQSSSKTSETRERVNFDVSETKREVMKGPGRVERITVAVLVDGISTTDAAGQVQWQPRPDAELEALRELVASAIGYSEERKDSITIKSLQFEPVPELGTTAEAGSPIIAALDVPLMIQLGIFAVVALVLGLFVVRPALTAAPAGAAADGLPGLPSPEGIAGDFGGDTLPALTGTIDDGAPSDLPDLGLPDLGLPDMGMMPAMGNAFEPLGGDADPVERLRQLIADRREETLETLRTWMEEPESAG